jgi:hypothetical protein
VFSMMNAWTLTGSLHLTLRGVEKPWLILEDHYGDIAERLRSSVAKGGKPTSLLNLHSLRLDGLDDELTIYGLVWDSPTSMSE